LQGEKDGRKLSYGGMQGIPMVATSPVRHEPPLGLNPMDIHGYQPPWKSLSEFALHGDIDRMDPNGPQFQHLMGQMHGYPDLIPPGMRLPPLGPLGPLGPHGPPPPPGPHGPPPPGHELMFGPPPPDMLGHGPPPHDGHGPLGPPPEDWPRDGPPEGPPRLLYPPHPEAGEGEFSYLDTSDDSGRHTGPDPSSP